MRGVEADDEKAWQLLGLHFIFAICASFNPRMKFGGGSLDRNTRPGSYPAAALIEQDALCRIVEAWEVGRRVARLSRDPLGEAVAEDHTRPLMAIWSSVKNAHLTSGPRRDRWEWRQQR